MKKLLLLVLIVLSVLVAACGETKLQESQKTDAPHETESPDPADTTTTMTPTTTTTTTTMPPIGTRRNPGPMGQTRTLFGELDGGEISFDLTLSNPIRGEEARKLAEKWNMFNDPGDDEFLILDAEFFLEKWEHPNDNKFTLSSYDFDYYTQSFNKYNPDEIIVMEGEFKVEAYEGATVKGKLGFVVPKDDNGFLVLYDEFWWKLTE